MFRGHWWVFFRDTETGALFEGRYGGHCYQDEYKERRADATRLRDLHVKTVEDGLTSKLAGVKVSIQAWTALEKDPLGKLPTVAEQAPA